MNILEIEARVLDASTKGLPAGEPVTPAAVAARGWNLLRDDLPYPVLVLREPALAHNLSAMARWCAKNGFFLAPHAKTTLCPQIWKRQMDLGAWGLTVATAQQARLCVRFGVPRILIANQLVGRENVRCVVSALNADPRIEIGCLVDSVEGAGHLAACAREAGAGRPLGVLLEVGRAGWRAGVRSLEEARAVVAAVDRHADVLDLRGVEGFEGLATMEEVADVQGFLDDLQATAEDVARVRPAPDGGLILSIGGSGYLDYVQDFLRPLRKRFRPIVRSGCSVTSDHGIYASQILRARARGKGPDGFPELRPALELWSVVQSVRDGTTAILSFGRRDAPYDSGLPVPLFSLPPGGRREDARLLPDARIVRLNDQHAFLSLPPGTTVRVGDRVACGISHPCTAFDKWPVVPVVDPDDRVVDLYCTYF